MQLIVSSFARFPLSAFAHAPAQIGPVAVTAVQTASAIDAMNPVNEQQRIELCATRVAALIITQRCSARPILRFAADCDGLA
jgi:hypothetical protein